ncbi:MAG: NAD(P)H-binding protein [Candidatus Micrarchaeaceae archaeon]
MSADEKEIKNVAVMGSTGFVGYNTAKELVEHGLRVRALVRKGAEPKKISKLSRLGVEIIEVNYSRVEEIEEALRGCEAAYNFIGSSYQSVKENVYESNTQMAINTVNASKGANVKLYIYNSGLGVNPQTTQSYFISKLRAERIIRKSGLRYIIFRPSYIIGYNDEFSEYILKNASEGKPIPIYGSGKYRIQPVYIGDVVKIYALCISLRNNWMKTYDLVGEEIVCFSDYVEMLARSLTNKNPLLTYVELEQAYRDAMRQESRRRHNRYLSVDELDVLISDFVSSPLRVKKDFGIKMTPLRQAIKEIVRAYLESKK